MTSFRTSGIININAKEFVSFENLWDIQVLMDNTSEIIGKSRALLEVLKKAETFASVPRPLLIRGERGTGKELLASFIHNRSTHASGPFIAVNCAVFNDELLVSELFGHERGAFTGAASRRIGYLEKAHRGTIFFDEVGNMSLRFQESLLRVLETKKFERLGGKRSMEVDSRFVFATNADIENMMERGEFRTDFYDRIAFETLTMPPLRQRRIDIPLLIAHFTLALVREIPNFEPAQFSPEATRQMMEYYWPGNIRELKNVVERIQLKQSTGIVHTVDLPQEITASAPIGNTFHEKIEAYKKHLILSAWRDSDRNQRKASDTLGISYDHFRHYFMKYALKDLAD